MIICSVSTIPDRSLDFIRTLDELLLSTIVPDFIYVSISKFYPRLNKSHTEDELNQIKLKLETYPIPNLIIFYDNDIGPCSKLLTPLSQKKYNDEDCIIIMDDDNGLFPTAIECLISGYRSYGKESVYGIMGTIGSGDSTNFVHGELVHGGYYPVDLLGGYRGVLYPGNLIEYNSLLDWVNKFIEEYSRYGMIPDHDDSIFSEYLKYKKIESRVVPVHPNNILNYWPKENKNGIFQDNKLDKSLSIFHNTLKKLHGSK